MKSVTLTTAGTAYRLGDLIDAIDPNPILDRLGLLIIQYDLGNAGNLYIGNSDVSPTNCGSHLAPSQALNVAILSTGLTLVEDIYLRSDTNSVQVNLIMSPIGM